MNEESRAAPFEPSLAGQGQEGAVSQSSVQAPSGYDPCAERTVQEFDEADFQSEWWEDENVLGLQAS